MKSAAKKTDKKAEQNPGALGGVFGCSVTSVLRRLGKDGISTAHARAILKAMKVKASDTTVSIQIGNGKRGEGKPAELTKSQVDELKKAAPEPKPEK